MATNQKTPGSKEEQDDNYNPGENQWRDTVGGGTPAEDGDGKQGRSTAEKERDPKQPSGGKSDESLSDREGGRRKQSGGDHATSGNDSGSDRQSRRGSGGLAGIKRNKKFIGGAFAIGGLGAVVVALFMAFLGLKLEGLIKSTAASVARIPEYAIERRLEFLTVHYLANKAMNGMVNENNVFVCKNGGVACSLFNTWRTTRYERKLGIREIEPLNRTRVGGGASEWRIVFNDGRELSGTSGRNGNLTALADDLSSKIDNSKDMRRFLKKEIKNNTHWVQIYKRYAMRKMLMKKYGVRGWLGPAKLEEKRDSWADRFNAYRSNMKKRLIGNTLGRVTPRFAIYLSCYSGGADCKDILKNRDFGIPGRSEVDRDKRDQACSGSGESRTCDSERDRRQFDQEVSQDTSKTTNEVSSASSEAQDLVDSSSDSDLSRAVSQILSKRVLGLVGGAISIVSILDLFAHVVDSVDQGAANIVQYDMGEIAYAGFATELKTANDKMKEGDLDIAQHAVLMDVMANVEESPHFQREAGVYSSATASTLVPSVFAQAEPGPVQRDCDGDGQFETLPPGETKCEKKKVGRNVLGWLTENGTWDALSRFTSAYLNSPVGWFFNLVGDAIGAVMSALGIDAAIAKVIKPFVDRFVGYLFDPPVTGAETDGEAYDALSGGQHVSYNAVMQYGRDNQDDNMQTNALGGGGQRLTEAETAAIERQVIDSEKTRFANKPLFEKLFDPHLEGSLAFTAILRLPTNIFQFALTPLQSLSSLAAPAAGAQAASPNPFGLIKYGYPVDDPALTANPSKYTKEKCTELAKERDESFGFNVVDGEEQGSATDETPVPYYPQSDPCALEEVVTRVGGANSTGSVDNAYDISSGISSQQELTVDSSVGIGTGGWTWPIADSSRPLTNCYRKPGHTGIDISATIGTPVLAGRGGTVVEAGPGGAAGNYIMIKHPGAERGEDRWTNYQHLNSIGVEPGNVVDAGQQIGRSGNSGYSTGPHLHFSVTSAPTLSSRLTGTDTLNPLNYLPKDGDRYYNGCS